MKLWISPSQLAYMYAECPRCTWLHYRGFKRPGVRMEEFALLDVSERSAFPKGTDLRPLGIPGVVSNTSAKVCSDDYGSDGIEARIFGEFDFLAALDAGGFAVIDIKTGRPNEEKVERYTPQISAYALALTEPDRHMPMDIRSGYILNCWPETATYIGEARALMFDFRFAVQDVPLELQEVRRTVRSLVELVREEKAPPSGEACRHCIHAKRLMGIARTEAA